MFGDVLRGLRKDANLTQKELSIILGTSESTVGMYERNQREPSFETLEAIADYFNVDMDFLTGRSAVKRAVSVSPSGPSPAPSLSPDETRLIADYRDASDEIREEAAAMLHRSAERSRQERRAAAG